MNLSKEKLRRERYDEPTVSQCICGVKAFMESCPYTQPHEVFQWNTYINMLHLQGEQDGENRYLLLRDSDTGSDLPHLA